MKKRLLSILLSVLLAFSALLPLTALAAGEGTPAAPTYPEITATDYDALYVKEGLVFAMDLFSTNRYWNTAGTTYAVPVGPSENTAYWYDENKDEVRDANEIYNFAGNAADIGPYRIVKRTVTKVNGANASYSDSFTENTTEYKTLAAAQAALPSNVTQSKDGPTVGDIKYEAWQIAGPALRAAYNQWQQEERTYLSQFITYRVSDSIFAHSYFPTISAPRSDFPTNSKKLFSVFTQGEGFLKMRTDYHSSGGFMLYRLVYAANENDQYRGSDSLSLQMVTMPGNMTNSVPFLYMNVRPTVTVSGTPSTMAFTGFASNSAFLPTEGISGDPVSVPLNEVSDFTLTLRGAETEGGVDSFTVRLHDKTIFSATGTYAGALNESMYFGWSSSARNAEIYAVRQYNKELSDRDLRRNHLADLCKWFRLDISSFVKNGELAVNLDDLATLAVLLSPYTIKDDRATVEAAFHQAVATITITGEGEAFEIFNAAVRDGLVNAAELRALPEEYHNEVYTAFKTFRSSNQTADAAACQAAVDAAIRTILARDYADYYDKTPLLTADAFRSTLQDPSEAALHFIDVARTFSLDLSELAALHPLIREYVFESFSDIHPDVPALTAILSKRLHASITEFAERHFGEPLVVDLITFLGYQLRLDEAAGVRAVFEVNTDILATLEQHGYKVTFGSLQKSLSSNGLSVTKEDGAWVPTTPTSGAAATQNAVYTTDGGYTTELIDVENTPNCFTHEYYSYSSISTLYFTAYAIIEREGEEPIVCYASTAGENYGAGVTLRQLATRCRDVLGITGPAIQVLCLTPLTSVYVDNRTLTDRRVLATPEAADVIEAFSTLVKEKTGTTLLTAEAGVTPKNGYLRFEAGTAAALTLDGEDIVFTYTQDLEGDLAALAAAFDAVTKHTVGTKEVNVSLLYSGRLPTP